MITAPDWQPPIQESPEKNQNVFEFENIIYGDEHKQSQMNVSDEAAPPVMLTPCSVVMERLGNIILSLNFKALES